MCIVAVCMSNFVHYPLSLILPEYNKRKQFHFIESMNCCCAWCTETRNLEISSVKITMPQCHFQSILKWPLMLVNEMN